MTDPTTEFLKLRRDADTARRKADEAAGALKQTMDRLKQMGHKSVADAEKARQKLDGEVEELERRLAEGIDAYREKFNK